MNALRRIGLPRIAGWARVFGANAFAERLLETARQEFPDDVRTLTALGFLYAQQDRRREALALFDARSRSRRTTPSTRSTAASCCRN